MRRTYSMYWYFADGALGMKREHIGQLELRTALRGLRSNPDTEAFSLAGALNRIADEQTVEIRSGAIVIRVEMDAWVVTCQLRGWA